MTTLVEDPTPIIFFGVLVEAVLAVVLFRTGRGVLLWAIIGVLVLVLAGVWLEWLVVTEVERVEAVIEGARAALAANDEKGVMKHIHRSAREIRNLVSSGFRQVHFTDAKITNLKIKINNMTSPPTATADVTGIAWFEALRSDIPRNKHLLSAAVELRLFPEGWLITDYKLKDDPLGS